MSDVLSKDEVDALVNGVPGEEVDSRIEDSRSEELVEDKQKLEQVSNNLKQQEKEAIIIDGEKRLVERNIKKDERIIQKVELDVSDDDISFDFSKVKKFFKGFGQSDKSHKSTNSEDDISIDYKQIFTFFKKYAVVFLILIPLLFSVYIRMIPASLPITDEWAENTLLNINRDIIGQQIRSQYPNLPSANLDNLITDEVNKLVKNNEILISTPEGIQKAPYKDAISQYSTSFKDRLQKEGQTYLIAIDPYFWIHKARNILENGYPGDELRNKETGEICEVRSEQCVPWNNHMIAPLGREVGGDMLHAHFIANYHKFMKIFNPDQDLMKSAFIIPVILSALCVIPAFFIARRVGGNVGGFVAAFVVAIHPAFLTRTVGGFSDTDAYNVLFPLLITWLIIEAFETKNHKKTAIISTLAGLLVALYTISWGGWWYIFDFLLVSLIAYILIYLIRNRDSLKNVFNNNEIRHTLIVLIFFFFSSLIFTTLFTGISTFNGAFSGPMGFVRLKEVGIDSVWPNVFTTVAEQNSASLNNVINQIGTGSLLLFFAAILGIYANKHGHRFFGVACIILALIDMFFFFILMGTGNFLPF